MGGLIAPPAFAPLQPTLPMPRPFVCPAGIEHRVDDDFFLVDPVHVHVDLSAVIARSFEEFLDLLSEGAGAPLLMQQAYEIVPARCTADTLCFAVRGDLSMHVEGDDEGDEGEGDGEGGAHG